MLRSTLSTHSRRSARWSYATMIAATLLISGGCGESTGPKSTEPIVVSGALTGPNVASLPEGSRVVVVWSVTSTSPDYGYVYGVGTVDRSAGTFTVTLNNAPPADALNRYGSYSLGVGTVFVVGAGFDPRARRLDDFSELEAAVLGAAGQHAVIYTRGAAPEALPSWLSEFPAGYSAGRGVKQTEGFDTFEKVSPDSFELIVDDLNNIEFVNWT